MYPNDDISDDSSFDMFGSFISNDYRMTIRGDELRYSRGVSFKSARSNKSRLSKKLWF